MAIRYSEDMQCTNSCKFAVVDIADLFLDEENPRFASSTLIESKSNISQHEIINYLVEYANALTLAERINLNEGLFNESTISTYFRDGKLVVLEGNRRIAACKLLLDNSLLSERLSLHYTIPALTPQTRAHIEAINAVIYDNSADAQRYIAFKHTQPEVEKWTTFEQFNYYYSQFTKGKSPFEIASGIRGVKVSTIEKKITQYLLYKEIFDVTKEQHPNLLSENTDMLPVVSAFMPALLTPKKQFSLNINVDKNGLRYIVLPSQKDLYHKILLKIGEAFFVRPIARKSSELETRFKSDLFRISSDEIKNGKGKIEKLIEDDIRIPGLKALIYEFRNEEIPKNESLNNMASNPINQNGVAAHHYKTAHLSADLFNQNQSKRPQDLTSNTTLDVSNAERKEFKSKEKELSYFADLRYEHLDPSNPLNFGLVAVAKEIKAISNAEIYTAYYKFPLASAFLLRSLIEQVIIRQLKITSTYERLNEKAQNSTPALGAMISDMISQVQKKDYSDFNNDRFLAKDFNSCFSGLGTKDHLDLIIHRPAECQPNKTYLNTLAASGLKSVLQKFINSFE